jgi:hypothetical protein
MVFLNGGGRRRDPEQDAAIRRERARLARDLGDERGVAWAHEPRHRPRKFTIGAAVVLVVFAAAGALPLLFDDGDSGIIRADCGRVAVEASPGRVAAGQPFAWQASGPEQGRYVVALDAGEVTGPADGPVRAPDGPVLTGPVAFPGCRSTQTVSTAPVTRGTHEVVVFRRSGDRWERAAVALLRVS